MDQDDFKLDVRIVSGAPVIGLAPSADCTSDNCTHTPASAGIADC